MGMFDGVSTGSAVKGLKNVGKRVAESDIANAAYDVYGGGFARSVAGLEGGRTFMGKPITGLGERLTGTKPDRYTPQKYEVDQALRDKADKSYSIRRAQLGAGLGGAKNRGSIGLDTKPQAEMRGDQRALIEQLQAGARGEGPSAAQAQLQLGTDQNMRQALAMGASGRGNPALAMQAAGRQRAMASQIGAGQAAALRAQEQQSAQNQLASTLAGARGQDMGVAQTQLQGGITQQGQRDALQQFYEGQISGNVGQRANLDLAYEGINAGQFQAAEQAKARAAEADRAAYAQNQSGLMGMGAALGAAGIAAMSDVRAKKNISDVKPESVDEFFKALKAKNFEYKDASMGEGERVGLMAQDVENTELGKKLVSQDGDGMRNYDPQVLDGIMLSAISKLMKERKNA